MPAGQGSQNFFAGGIHSPFAQGRLVRVAESEGIGELDGVPDADTFHDRDGDGDGVGVVEIQRETDPDGDDDFDGLGFMDVVFRTAPGEAVEFTVALDGDTTKTSVGVREGVCERDGEGDGETRRVRVGDCDEEAVAEVVFSTAPGDAVKLDGDADTTKTPPELVGVREGVCERDGEGDGEGDGETRRVRVGDCDEKAVAEVVFSTAPGDAVKLDGDADTPKPPPELVGVREGVCERDGDGDGETRPVRVGDRDEEAVAEVVFSTAPGEAVKYVVFVADTEAVTITTPRELLGVGEGTGDCDLDALPVRELVGEASTTPGDGVKPGVKVPDAEAVTITKPCELLGVGEGTGDCDLDALPVRELVGEASTTPGDGVKPGVKVPDTEAVTTSKELEKLAETVADTTKPSEGPGVAGDSDAGMPEGLAPGVTLATGEAERKGGSDAVAGVALAASPRALAVALAGAEAEAAGAASGVPGAPCAGVADGEGEDAVGTANSANRTDSFSTKTAAAAWRLHLEGDSIF